MRGVGQAGIKALGAGSVRPPAATGVYAFRDEEGRLLYVGVSRNLDRRVHSYFAGCHPPASKAARLARLAATVTWWRCGSELEALVLEARTIRRERPYFNRLLKQTGGYTYVRFDPRDPFPRLEPTRSLDEAACRYLGPLPGGPRLDAALADLADALGLRTCAGTVRVDPGGRACLRLDLRQCAAPCLGRIARGEYGRRLTHALAALAGGHPEVARAAGARSDRLPVALPGRLSAALAALRAARRTSRVIAVVPAAEGVGHRLLALGSGRLREALGASDARSLRDAFERALVALAAVPPLLVPREDLDEVRIVTAWLASARGRAAAVDVDRLGRAGAWAAVEARVAPGPLFVRGDPQHGYRPPKGSASAGDRPAPV